MYHFMKKHKNLFLSLGFLVLFSVTVSYATPPTSPYNPGDTLDPGCAPGSTNCTVTASGNFVHLSGDETIAGTKTFSSDIIVDGLLTVGRGGGSNPSNSTVVGYHTLFNNTTGTNNTAVGAWALEKNTTGISNTAIGSFAFRNNTDGQNNDAIGYSSLYYNTTGNSNNAFGHFALFYNTTGSYNIAIGTNTMTLVSTGSHNIAIGSYSEVSDGTANGQLNIGNVLYGTGIYQVKTASSVPTADGRIGIGVTAPTARLQLAAGSATAGTAPLKLTAGPTVDTAEAGAIEYDGSHLYFTATNGGTRYQLDQQVAGLTSSQWSDVAGGINYAGGNVGIGTTTPDSSLQVVGGVKISPTVSPANQVGLTLAHAMSGAGLFFDAVADRGTFTSTGTGAYASYDAFPTINGTINYDHTRAFQDRAVYSGSGTLAELTGMIVYPTANGPVTNTYGTWIKNIGGTGSVGTQYGIKIDDLTFGGANYSIYTGSAPSQFNANVNITGILDATNKIGVGTASPLESIDIDGGYLNISAGALACGNCVQPAGIKLSSDASSNAKAPVIANVRGAASNDQGINFATYNGSLINAVRIIGNGNVGIGNTAPAYLLHVGSSSTPSGIIAEFQTSAANCTLDPTTTGGLTCSSDMNLKQNVSNLSDGSNWNFSSNITIANQSVLAKVLALNPVAYNWKTENSGTTKHDGFIAQEVRQVFPDLVSQDQNTQLLSLNYTGLIPYTIEAIKEMDLNITSIGDLTKTNTWRDAIMNWLGSATNGITNIFSKQVTTPTLCVGTNDNKTCITKDQLDHLLQQSSSVQGSGGTQQGSDVPMDSSDSSSTQSPEVAPVEVQSPEVTDPEVAVPDDTTTSDADSSTDAGQN